MGSSRSLTDSDSYGMPPRKDDPYADWWLIKIDDALEVASARISVVHDEIRSALSVATALRIAPASAKEPFRIRLQFSSPYAYRAANVHFPNLIPWSAIC